jgi:hypothetical protein
VHFGGWIRCNLRYPMRPAFTFYEQTISILTFTIVPLLICSFWVASLDSSVYYSPRCMPVDCGVQCNGKISPENPRHFHRRLSTSARPFLISQWKPTQGPASSTWVFCKQNRHLRTKGKFQCSHDPRVEACPPRPLSGSTKREYFGSCDYWSTSVTVHILGDLPR